jgi:hypothetical protein
MNMKAIIWNAETWALTFDIVEIPADLKDKAKNIAKADRTGR